LGSSGARFGDLIQRDASIIGVLVGRELFQELLKSSLGVVQPIHILLLNLADAEQRLGAVVAVGIGPQQETVGDDRGIEIFRLELLAHLAV